MADNKKILAENQQVIAEKINDYNEALSENDAAKAAQIERDLKEAESDYAEAKRVEVFCELKAKENPVKAAIEMRKFPIVSHKTIREDGIVKGFEIDFDKVREIDLVKFCEFCKLPTMWKYKVERLNKLLAIRMAKDLKMSEAEIKKLKEKFYMSSQAQKLKLGATPESNNQVCKLIQEILDEILYEDNGKGKNTYKVNPHDAVYLDACYSGRDRKELTVKLAKTSFVHKLLLDVMHRVVTGKVYGLNYREMKEAPVAEVKVTVEKKPKASEVETVVVEKKSA